MSKVRFDRKLLERYGGRGPRYTSYPTAPQFHSGFGDSQYVERAIRSNTPINEQDDAPPPLSLYLHLPFCRTLCYYCGCTKIITRNEDRAQRYLDVIQKEAALHSPMYDRSRQVEQLHLGGGSPTFYSDEQLGELMDTLRREFTFAPPDKLQCSIEVDPRTVAPDRIKALAALGFNRLSLGVQDFDEEVQGAVNRLQSREDTLALLDAARANGFRSVSVDLIYGLPKQTPQKFVATLETVIDARPDRISLYSYAHMPQLFKAQKLIDESTLPDGAEKLALLELSIETLCSAGYEYIGMDHFALADDELVKARESDQLHRNFQGYSTHAYCDLVSLGASAIGHVAHSFYQNEKNTNRYSEAVLDGRLPIVKGLTRDADDIVRDDVIQDLMCQGRVDFEQIEEHFDIDFSTYFFEELEALKPLEADGLVRLADDAIHVTPTGQLLLRAVAMTFDRYLREPAPEQRYSKVI